MDRRIPLSAALWLGLWCGLVGSAQAQSYRGTSIKANVTTLARACRVRQGTCTDVETTARIGVYFGQAGNVFVYEGTDQGKMIPLGQWVDDKQGHAVRWTISGQRAIWEASSEKFINTIVFTRKGSTCAVQNIWKSDNPEIALQSRGVRVASCRIYEGNANT